MITPEKLQKYARLKQLADAKVHADALEEARKASSVDTHRRLAHFLGQLFVECGAFTIMEENLNYKSPERLDAVFKAVKGTEDARALIKLGPEAIANRVYANKNGNGPESSGDGWRYRGSGYIQLTGRDNYEEFGKVVGEDLVKNPDLARTPRVAAKVAFAFWDSRGCSRLADQGDVEGVTKKINGLAMLGLAERRDAVARAVGIWP